MSARDASHVLARFPAERGRIQELALVREGFAELCADYDEVVEMLRRIESGSTPHAADRSTELRELRSALENEIAQALAKDPRRE